MTTPIRLTGELYHSSCRVARRNHFERDHSTGIKAKPTRAEPGQRVRGGEPMKQIILSDTNGTAKLLIDGIEITGLYSIKIEKSSDGPIRVELSGAVTNEVRVGP